MDKSYVIINAFHLLSFQTRARLPRTSIIQKREDKTEQRRFIILRKNTNPREYIFFLPSRANINSFNPSNTNYISYQIHKKLFQKIQKKKTTVNYSEFKELRCFLVKNTAFILHLSH